LRANHNPTRLHFRFTTACVALAFLIGMLPTRARAADIGDALALRWATATPDEFIPVLIQMRDRVDLRLELPQLVYGSAAPGVRHEIVMTALQTRARLTQASLLENLQTGTAAGRVRNVHPYWLDNLVGVEVKPGLLNDLLARSDVARVVLLPEVTIDPPVRHPMGATAAGHESSLDDIGAPTMWAMGYTGRGRIVCGIDTGVRGTHFGLADRWRGLKVPWQQAWYDPRGLTNFPADIGELTPSHGTHTMGTMCGADTLLGDTVGVAPAAEWIAAFGISSNQLNTFDLIDCLHWCADPDDNPNTTEDVPDVLNCSWRFATTGIQFPCNDIMDGIIQHLEAVGVIVIWAAGNEGSTQGSIGYPANSGTSFGTNFAIGNYSSSTGAIHFSSSRGPTPCAGDSIKPEVVAPGVTIRSTLRSGDSFYGPMTGTSMAAPHVAGAAAILRQTAPSATPAQIKQALFVSAIDKGTPGEDNDYGMGLIWLPAAADSLSVLMGGPELRADSEYIATPAISPAPGDSLHAGDTVSLTFWVRNRSQAAATGAWLKLTESDPWVTLVDDSVDIGIVAAGGSIQAPVLRYVVNPATPKGQPLSLTLHLGATGYASSAPLRYATDPAPVPGLLTHDNTVVEFTVTNYGLYGIADDSFNPFGGVGFLYAPSATNHQVEAALMIGRSQNQVSDAARSAGGAGAGGSISDHDFAPSPGGALQQIPNLETAFQTTWCRFDDALAENRIDVRVTQRSLIFPTGADEGFVLLILTLENISAGPLTGVQVGILHDCDFPFPILFTLSDSTGFDGAHDLAYMFDETSITAGPYRGVSVVSDGGATSYRSISAAGELYLLPTYEIILSDSTKWDYLSGGIGPPAVSAGTSGDAATFIGAGPFNLFSPADTVQVAFAFVGSEDGLARLQLNAEAAKTRYDAIMASVDVDDDVAIPRSFALHANYPNPFNPDTRIAFSLDQPGSARLTVFNLLGQRIATLFDRTASAGRHELLWDGTDERGQAVASGVYFYRLDVGDESRTRKMLLLR